MQKKIKIEVWVEPATTAGGLSQFIDNIKQFAEDLTKYGVPDMGEKLMIWKLQILKPRSAMNKISIITH